MRFLVLLVLLCGCSYIPEREARWIATEATHIDQVRGLLGGPEELEFGRDRETAKYIDSGLHVSRPSLLIPGWNVVAALTVLPTEALLGGIYRRELWVSYDPKTGRILSVEMRGDE